MFRQVLTASSAKFAEWPELAQLIDKQQEAEFELKKIIATPVNSDIVYTLIFEDTS